MSEASAQLREELLDEGRVLVLTFGEGKANIFSTAMMQAIDAALASHVDDEHLRLVVLRGAGGRFSFGASVQEHVKEQAPGMLEAFRKHVRGLAGYPVPIAALVEGPCLGGAFEVALVCHFVFATPKAKFACPEIKLGVFPPVLIAAGAHRLGGAAMERLTLTGGELDAAAAGATGWLAGILDGEGEPLEQVLAWYRENLAPLSAWSLRAATEATRTAGGLLELLGTPLERAERLYLERLLPSHDGNEGIAAFLERRKPEWKDA